MKPTTKLSLVFGLASLFLVIFLLSSCDSASDNEDNDISGQNDDTSGGDDDAAIDDDIDNDDTVADDDLVDDDAATDDDDDDVAYDDSSFASRWIVIVIICNVIVDDAATDDDDDDVAYDDDYYPPGCEGTVPPMLLGISFLVNGEETEMPATVYTTDELQIAMEYSDEDCNIAEGRILIKPDQLEPEYSELADFIFYSYTIENIGCSSEEEEEPYILTIDSLDYLLPNWLTRTMPLHFHLDDVCGFPSQPFWLPLDFTVVEE